MHLDQISPVPWCPAAPCEAEHSTGPHTRTATPNTTGRFSASCAHTRHRCCSSRGSCGSSDGVVAYLAIRRGDGRLVCRCGPRRTRYRGELLLLGRAAAPRGRRLLRGVRFEQLLHRSIALVRSRQCSTAGVLAARVGGKRMVRQIK